jgi:hypothetical protein
VRIWATAVTRLAASATRTRSPFDRAPRNIMRRPAPGGSRAQRGRLARPDHRARRRRH